MFYGLLLLAMETKTNKKRALLVIIQDLIILFFFRKIGKTNDKKNVPSLSF